MPRQTIKTPELRSVTFNLPVNDYEELAEHARITSRTVTEVIRKGLALEVYLDEAIGPAGSMPAEGVSGERAQEILLATGFITGHRETLRLNTTAAQVALLAIQHIR